ncbi:MAG: hypothetical protein DSY55_06400 [Clostridia bacterium]|nr:MAG: hypothetical protein DSY55_06400 [Clostridia bacterium]
MKTILVPLSKPAQAAILSTFILPVARAEKASVILLHVCSPDLRKNVDTPCTTESAPPTWLQEAAQRFHDANVTVEIIQREARNTARGIRDAVKALKPDLLALSWRRPGQGQKNDDNRALHDLLLDVPCDLVVWRGSQAASPPHRILIPSAGGPNVELGFQLARDFHNAYGSKVLLLTVLPPNATDDEEEQARQALAQRIQKESQKTALPLEVIETRIIKAKTPAAGILQMATSVHSDVVIMGASRESVIHSIRFGEIPERVALRAQTPVLVIKRPPPRSITFYRRIWDIIDRAVPDVTEAERVAVYRESYRNARATRDFFTMITLSTTIAAFGMMQNAPAVIIGAMLIAPLMSAIIAMGQGIVEGDARLLSFGARTTLWGILVTLGVSFALEALIPFNAVTPEMLSRAAPNLLDMGVALTAGAAGAYALARKNVSSSLPGVAIAVALIPPLTTVGMALALTEWRIAGGAALLFITNLVGIVSMSSLVFLAMGFMPNSSRYERMRIFSRGGHAVLIMILLIALPLTFLTVRQLKIEHTEAAVKSALEIEIGEMQKVTLMNWQYQENDNGGLSLEVEVEAARTIPHQESVALQKRLANRLHRPVALILKVIPTTRLDALAPPTQTPTFTPAPTQTATLSPTPTATRTITPSPTPTATTSPTATATLTPSPRPARTVTITITPTAATQ